MIDREQPLPLAARIAAIPLPVSEAELPLYRDRTESLLRKYFCLALQTGRLPSLLGREFFRARVTSYRLRTLEDAVIFVHDMERCVELLSETAKKLIAHIALQGHTEAATAEMMQWSRRHVVRRYPEALDELSAILLRVKMLCPGLDAHRPKERGGKRKAAAVNNDDAMPPTKLVVRVEACQEMNYGELPQLFDAERQIMQLGLSQSYV